MFNINVPLLSRKTIPDKNYSDQPLPTKSSYTININGNVISSNDTINKTLKGEHVDAKWGREFGIAWLGTDEVHEPIGTLTLNLVPETNSQAYWFSSATLSTTDVKVGTAAELNARLYKLKEGSISFCIPYVINDDYLLCDTFSIQMERVIVHQGDEPEDVLVTGKFNIVN